jgi:AraC-like DNA-binding protein
MLTWSTDGFGPHERFDAWLELRIARQGGGSGQLARQERAGFRASYSACTVGGIHVSQMHASSYRFQRSAADIARMPLDRFVIVQQTGAGCRVHPGDGEPFVVPAGAFSTHHTDKPYALVPATENGGFHCRVIGIPFELCLPFLERAPALGIQALPVDNGMGGLFASYFDAFVRQAPQLHGRAADVAARTLAQLALGARGLAAPQGEAGRDAVGAGQLEAARQFVGRNLQRADLTPASVARAVGVSVRRLHLLFEPTGTTFSRYVLARRLDRARQFLALQPDRPILDIALACGIETSSVFYRAFREAFGMAPNAYRRSLGRDA